jgi:hypothetical protein
MPPLQLPPPNTGNIPLPNAPGNPPTLSDITNAAKLLERVSQNFGKFLVYIFDISLICIFSELAGGPPKVQAHDVARARVYLHNVCDHYIRDGHNACPTLDEIRETVTTVVTDSLQPVNQKIDAINHKLNRLLRSAFKVCCPRHLLSLLIFLLDLRPTT